MSNTSTNLIEQRRNKLDEIKKLGFDPYPHRFEFSQTVADLVDKYSSFDGDQLEEAAVAVRTAGRIMSFRRHGKVGFVHLSGVGVRLQLYVRKDRVGEELYALFRLLDVGDIIGVEGVLFRTKTGELTIFADKLEFLSKGLLPLPEKWHGLSDVETRYRQRYVDLIANPEVRDVFVRRSEIIREMRAFLEEHGYLEVETPMMQPVAGGATARPFQTFHEALGIPLYLRIAPELYLKRLTVGGLDRVYEINRSFRNEGISRQHNPEFTMLEFYVAYRDYKDLMDFTEAMLKRVVEAVHGELVVPYGGDQIDFSRFARYTMLGAIREFWPGSDKPSEEVLREREALTALLTELQIEFNRGENWGKLLGLLFESVVEKHLVQPTFIYDYPVELSPLSKKKDSDSSLVERFELYLARFEVANAYSELNDPEEQRSRFESQLEERDRGDLEAHAMDEDYVRALSYGMPPTAGEGIGIDRLSMVLTNSQSIRDVILFPQLRPESSQSSAEESEEVRDGKG
jgi:lysyl-tRNA synthetase class 2